MQSKSMPLKSQLRLPAQTAPINRAMTGSTLLDGSGVEPSRFPIPPDKWPPWLPPPFRPGPYL